MTSLVWRQLLSVNGMIFRRNQTVRIPPTEIRVRASSHLPYSQLSLSSCRLTERGVSLEKETLRNS